MGGWMACNTETTVVSPLNPGIYEIALYHFNSGNSADYKIVVVEGDGVPGSLASPTELNVGVGAAGDTDVSFVVRTISGTLDNYFEFVAAADVIYTINLAYTDLDITPSLFSNADFENGVVALSGDAGCQPCTTPQLTTDTTYYLKLSTGAPDEAYGDVTITITPP